MKDHLLYTGHSPGETRPEASDAPLGQSKSFATRRDCHNNPRASKYICSNARTFSTCGTQFEGDPFLARAPHNHSFDHPSRLGIVPSAAKCIVNTVPGIGRNAAPKLKVKPDELIWLCSVNGNSPFQSIFRFIDFGDIPVNDLIAPIRFVIRTGRQIADDVGAQSNALFIKM